MVPKKLVIAFLIAYSELAYSQTASGATSESQVVNVTGVRDPTWVAYRDVYAVLETFEKFSKPKHLVKLSYEIISKSKDSSSAPLSLKLIGTQTNESLEIDKLGRVAVPMISSAYDEGADFRLNRKSGTYDFRYLVQIKENAEGIYSPAGLREACQQVLNVYFRLGKLSHRLKLVGKECSGAKFIYDTKDNESAIYFDSASSKSFLPIESGKVVFRFSDWPTSGKLIAKKMPTAVEILLE